MKIFNLLAAGLFLAVAPLLPAQENIISNADFSNGLEGWKTSGFVGGKPGADGDWLNSAVIFNDTDEKTALRVTCKEPEGSAIDLTTEPNIPLDPAWVAAGRLKLSYKAKLTGFVLGNESWGRANVWIIFYNDNDKKVGEAISSHNKDIAEWKFMSTGIAIPSDATYLNVHIGFIGAMGDFEVRDLNLVPLPAAK